MAFFGAVISFFYGKAGLDYKRSALPRLVLVFLNAFIIYEVCRLVRVAKKLLSDNIYYNMPFECIIIQLHDVILKVVYFRFFL